MPEIAFLQIVILWFAIAFTIFVFYLLVPLSACLLIPYLLWVTYAAYLNWGIWRLNPQR